ncbi:MAG: NusG domain II-containing protein [Eubacterium sp.]|nr:NusG domain II-containing protein [Eubacterium sp.]
MEAAPRKNKSNYKRKLFTKADALLLAATAVLAVFLIVFPVLRGMDASKQPKLEILVENTRYGVYPLTENKTIQIGDGNVCEIRDGEVFMVKADCPDEICVHSRPISDRSRTIVCLPNKVILQIIDSDGKDEYDMISG